MQRIGAAEVPWVGRWLHERMLVLVLVLLLGKPPI